MLPGIAVREASASSAFLTNRLGSRRDPNFYGYCTAVLAFFDVISNTHISGGIEFLDKIFDIEKCFYYIKFVQRGSHIKNLPPI